MSTVRKFFTSGWFLWIFLTLIYVPLSFFQFFFWEHKESILISRTIWRVLGLIGLFVPIGFLSSIDHPEVLLFTIPFVFLSLFFSAKFAKRFNLTAGKRILYNLFVLLIVSLIIDLFLSKRWEAFYIILNGRINCC